MSAGTIVISGGILAGVILLCIVAVLCYCRLQYYCCKKNDSEVDVDVGSAVGADPLSHFPCSTCNALAMDGAAIAPVSLDQLDAVSHHHHHHHGRCPTCSPPLSSSSLYRADDARNGGERLGFHTYYENPSFSAPPSSPSPVSYYGPSDLFPPPPPPPRPYSTQV